MEITIKHPNTKKASKLIAKFLEMNENSDYDYIEKDNVLVGYNQNSGFSYIYLENNPSISLCLNESDDFCIIYSSGLDGLEFITYEVPSALDRLESKINKVYKLDEDKRGDDYNNTYINDSFIEAMDFRGWGLI